MVILQRPELIISAYRLDPTATNSIFSRFQSIHRVRDRRRHHAPRPTVRSHDQKEWLLADGIV